MIDGDARGDGDLRRYYAKRASEYEAIYAKPERQADLAAMTTRALDTFRSRRVIEIACGTGWWSRHIASVATSLDALDINEETLAIARTKPVTAGVARFTIGDAYAPPMPSQPYDAAFAGFWWSHVLKRDLSRFLKGLHRVLAPGAKVAFLDNNYVEGSSTLVSRVDANGDSWQARKLADGSTHEVLKNFPSAHELLAAVAPWSRDAKVTQYDYFWWLDYSLDARA